jgi:hypothetical protein
VIVDWGVVQHPIENGCKKGLGTERHRDAISKDGDLGKTVKCCRDLVLINIVDDISGGCSLVAVSTVRAVRRGLL